MLCFAISRVFFWINCTHKHGVGWFKFVLAATWAVVMWGKQAASTCNVNQLKIDILPMRNGVCTWIRSNDCRKWREAQATLYLVPSHFYTFSPYCLLLAGSINYMSSITWSKYECAALISGPYLTKSYQPNVNFMSYYSYGVCTKCELPIKKPYTYLGSRCFMNGFDLRSIPECWYYSWWPLIC